jgi:adenosylmethionine-8-amino-7-oxononanoate aminotransferase
MARHYHKVRGKAQKVKFISRYNSYHGATLGALSAGGKRGQKASFEPLVPGFIQSQTPHCYRCPYGKEYPGCGITCAVVIDDVIGMEGAETVAGVIVEPMMRRGGAAPPPVEYLPMLREICDRHDVLLIFDEVVTGFGRTGRMFGSFTFDVVPDIMACGKGISSGYAPLSATLTTEEIAFELDKTITNGTHYVHGHTYGGNPVSCAAGIANIQVLLEDKLVENSETMGIHLRKKLNELKSLEVIGAVEGKGLLSGVEFVKDASTKERFPDDLAFGHRVGEECRKRGILLRPDIHDMAFSPPLIVTEDEIDRMVEVVRESIQAVLQSLH